MKTVGNVLVGASMTVGVFGVLIGPVIALAVLNRIRRQAPPRRPSWTQ